jgi:hypothetical protein
MSTVSFGAVDGVEGLGTGAFPDESTRPTGPFIHRSPIAASAVGGRLLWSRTGLGAGGLLVLGFESVPAGAGNTAPGPDRPL